MRRMDEWIRQAWQARERAYAPYSQFAVGAALIDAEGSLFTGCNIENVSFGLTMCAERVAIGSAIAAGARVFRAIVIVADTKLPISPCGACRQVLAEFAPELEIILATRKETQRFSLAELFPRPATGILDQE
jgi:cytidine deaminase